MKTNKGQESSASSVRQQVHCRASLSWDHTALQRPSISRQGTALPERLQVGQHSLAWDKSGLTVFETEKGENSSSPREPPLPHQGPAALSAPGVAPAQSRCRQSRGTHSRKDPRQVTGTAQEMRGVYMEGGWPGYGPALSVGQRPTLLKHCAPCSLPRVLKAQLTNVADTKLPFL